MVAIGLLAGCMPSPMQPILSIPPLQTSVPQPVQMLPPVVVQNHWKPDSPPRDWRYIVLHHTASSGGSIDSIHESHLNRGWNGIGYHFLIGNGNGMDDGEIQPTYRWRGQIHGAHAKSPGNEYNEHGIGICLVGNFEEERPTTAQLESVKRLVGVLKFEYQLTGEQIVGHRDVKATACPGKYFPLAEIGRSSVFSVLAGRPGNYVTESPATFQIVTVDGSNSR